jgi:hypothetical protein
MYHNSAQFTLYRRAIMLVFLKVLVVLAEYATPITINQLATAFQQRELVFPFTYEHHLAELARLLGVLFGATVAECTYLSLTQISSAPSISPKSVAFASRLISTSPIGCSVSALTSTRT